MTTAHRRLLLVWTALMSLTLAMAVVADVTHASRLGGAWMGAIAVVTVFKARFVLSDYLGLRSNRTALQLFSAAIVLTLAVVIAAILAA